MGKSQETFSKKEREKKKLKKRQDKEQKKEERKSASLKGQGLEAMFAYVDHNGNLTDTPPDPKKKYEINQEDIKISTPKMEDLRKRIKPDQVLSLISIHQKAMALLRYPDQM